MNTHDNDNTRDHLDRDTLLTRIIDAEASAEDWAAFRTFAADEPEVWSELAEMQRQHDVLAGGLREAIAIADSIELPVHEHESVRPVARIGAVMQNGWSWGGWLAAAALLLAFTVGLPRGVGVDGRVPGTQAAGFSLGTPEEALDRYIDLGKQSGAVVGQSPDFIVLESTPLADGGGYEVVYLRQLIERREVRDLYRLGTDELGNTVRVPVEAGKALGVGAKAF
ncbi:MAG: hypothetical protein AAF078_11460 [Planctomycetota bacterium]